MRMSHRKSYALKSKSFRDQGIWYLALLTSTNKVIINISDLLK